MSTSREGDLPRTLMQMAGAPSEPPPLGETALVLIDCQREYVDGALPSTESGRRWPRPASCWRQHGRPGRRWSTWCIADGPAAVPSIPRGPTFAEAE